MTVQFPMDLNSLAPGFRELIIAIYIPIKVLVFLHYGLLGLAIATSVHLIVNFMLQLIILEKVTARALILKA